MNETILRTFLKIFTLPLYLLDFIQRFRIRYIGRIQVGTIQKNGWTGELPLYRGYCKTHGFFEDTPHGWRRVIRCPECS